MECARRERDNLAENTYVRQIQEYIRAHGTEDFSAREIEEACGLSYKYAGTLFKEATGQTIREYQRMLRIGRAQQLLMETDRSITEIAQLTGFTDVFISARYSGKHGDVPPASTAGLMSREFSS